MTNAELIQAIKAEVERLYNGEVPKHDQQCNFDDGYFVGIDAIAQFLDSLESEKPSEELEDEIERYLPKIPENPYNEELRVFARHFAQWQKNQILKEAVEGEFLYTPYPTIELDDSKDYNFTDFDWVRVIILKKED